MKWNPSQSQSAPAQPADASEPESGDSIESMIQSAVADGFAELRKELAPPRRFSNPPDTDTDTFTIPATIKRYSSLKNFAGPKADEKAYRFGMFCLGVYGKKQGIDFCLKHGIPLVAGTGDVQTKTFHENVNTSSGFLVPDEFQNDLIDLREKFGVFRQNARVVPMASDTRSDPRRVNGVTAYFVGESTAAAQSDKTWDRVRLTAKKLMVLTKYSNELNEDAVLNIGDDLAGEIAYAFALKEDQCGFNGDASAPYGGITGVIPKLLSVDPTGSSNPANIMGIVVGSGTGFATRYDGIVLADFNKLVAQLPEYADVPGRAKFYCSKFFWSSVMMRIATAAGGNRIYQILDSTTKKSFLGYDVVISQVMPKAPAVNQVCCLFGNLALAARLGDRRQTTIHMSEHALNAFEQDEIVIRGTERFDIVVHDVGDPTAAAGPARSAQAGNTAGPIVGLMTGAS
jgi:HK97 family phage major capsid protein